ncbi:hypothetical protein [Paenibacillus apiarius]|uniref:hypothetical protein n=1 Tax=Paenibacillus apiarius TaxID=46240 RepID=UPI003B3A259C
MINFGKVIVNGEEIEACCCNPNYIPAWIKAVFSWKALYCKQCGEVTGPVGKWAWLYDLGFCFFWRGHVELDNTKMTDEDRARLEEEYKVYD